MFYSYEVLSNKKYGVATIWLVATLGPKATITKKISRKAILSVNVRKACQTIMEPEVPLALRLQSNLLYGVSQVHNQQCGYVLTDAQSAQNNMRLAMRSVKGGGLDSQAGKARREQLVLMDDPAFVPELELPLVSFDMSVLDLESALGGKKLRQDHSQDSALLTLSNYSQASSLSSRHSLPALNIPPSSSMSPAGSNRLPSLGPFGGSSASKPPFGSNFGGLGPEGDDYQELGFLDDLDFEFDGEGNVVDIDPEERRRRLAAGSDRPSNDDFNNQTVRGERGENIGLDNTRTGRMNDDDGDVNLLIAEDEYAPVLPENAEPFPVVMTGALAVEQRSETRDENQSASDPNPPRGRSTSASAEARMLPFKRIIPWDRRTYETSATLRHWATTYLANMKIKKKDKKARRAAVLRKGSVEFLVWGQGLGRVGQGLQSSLHPFQLPTISNELATYAGEALRSQILGLPLQATTPSPKRKPSAAADEDGSDARRIRQRLSQDHDEFQVGRPASDDAAAFPSTPGQANEGQDIEIGREAPPSMEDYPSSAMPWNVSASARSRRAPSSSVPGSRHRLPSQRHSAVPSQARPGPRMQPLAAQSPLLGRGSGRALLPGLERLGAAADDDGAGRADDVASEGLRRGSSASAGPGPFAPPTAGETPAPAELEWTPEELDRESLNFLNYVKAEIVARQTSRGTGSNDDSGEGGPKGAVGFGELFPAENNARALAAQAFLHMLTLTSKNLLRVRQEAHEEWGAIWLSVDDVGGVGHDGAAHTQAGAVQE